MWCFLITSRDHLFILEVVIHWASAIYSSLQQEVLKPCSSLRSVWWSDSLGLVASFHFVFCPFRFLAQCPGCYFLAVIFRLVCLSCLLNTTLHADYCEHIVSFSTKVIWSFFFFLLRLYRFSWLDFSLRTLLMHNERINLTLLLTKVLYIFHFVWFSDSCTCSSDCHEFMCTTNANILVPQPE